MQIIILILTLLLLIPAALAGILHGLAACLAHVDELPQLFSEAAAALTGFAPFAPALGWLLAGFATLALAAWLICSRLP